MESIVSLSDYKYYYYVDLITHRVKAITAQQAIKKLYNRDAIPWYDDEKNGFLFLGDEVDSDFEVFNALYKYFEYRRLQFRWHCFAPVFGEMIDD